jgi:hypothetical protein
MPRRKVPTVVTVLAVFHFIVGGFGLLSGLCGGIFLLISGGNPARLFAFIPEAQKQLEVQQRILTERVPFYTAYQAEGLVVGLVLSALLVAAGVGLLRLRPWARVLCMVYAPPSILQTLFAAFYTLVYVTPASQEAARQAPFGANPQAAQAAQAGAEAGAAVGLILSAFMFLLMLAYPVITLVIVLLPSVGAAFRGEPAGGRRRRHVGEEPDEEPEEPDEDDEDRPRRRGR